MALFELDAFIAAILEICRLPPLPKDQTRVGDCQSNGRYTDHAALQDDEWDLLVREGAVKAALQLGDPEAGPDIDGQGRKANGWMRS